MKKKDVEIGGRYIAKVSGKLTTIQIKAESPYGGWDAVNVETSRAVCIKTAARLRRPAGTSTAQSIEAHRGGTYDPNRKVTEEKKFQKEYREAMDATAMHEPGIHDSDCEYHEP